MNRHFFHSLLIIPIMMGISCNNNGKQNKDNEKSAVSNYVNDQSGSFGYDLNFLKGKDDHLIVLKSGIGDAQIIVSAKYQAKVFTSTATGEKGTSFGWVNYKAFSGPLDAHMNAYGGENRFWLGPEGGKFSLFFKPDSKMVFDNWKTPAAFDSEPWLVRNQTGQSVTMEKNMHLINYKGTALDAIIERSIKILSSQQIDQNIGISLDSSVKVVGYQSDNKITNNGKFAWDESTGMPCIWILDMFKPSPSTVIVVPFNKTDTSEFSTVATTNYFGEIPADRLKHNDHVLFFKADGKSRGKLGVSPSKAKNVVGSYDSQNRVLTILQFDLDPSAKYLNQEWNTDKPSFIGDAVNAYNDGPLADGSQMGPFYEMESVSPAAFLKPGTSLSHKHCVYHFTGNEVSLNLLAEKLLGVSVDDIKNAF